MLERGEAKVISQKKKKSEKEDSFYSSICRCIYFIFLFISSELFVSQAADQTTDSLKHHDYHKSNLHSFSYTQLVIFKPVLLTSVVMY